MLANYTTNPISREKETQTPDFLLPKQAPWPLGYFPIRESNVLETYTITCTLCLAGKPYNLIGLLSIVEVWDVDSHTFYGTHSFQD